MTKPYGTHGHNREGDHYPTISDLQADAGARAIVKFFDLWELFPRFIRQLLEAVGTPDSIAQMIGDLTMWSYCSVRRAEARAIVLSAERVDGDTCQLTICTSRATRDVGQLKRGLPSLSQGLASTS